MGISHMSPPAPTAGRMIFFWILLIVDVPKPTQANAVGVTSVSIKTGTESKAESDAVATLEICDSFNSCCKTQDLDKSGNDRKQGQTDVYEKGYLGNCEEERLNPNSSWTAKLELSSSFGNALWRGDAWFVEWIRIMGTEHVEFGCQFNVWLEKEVITNKYKTSYKATCNIKGCSTLDGEDPCAFPFTFEGQEINSCIHDSDPNPWCLTTAKDKANCSSFCPVMFKGRSLPKKSRKEEEPVSLTDRYLYEILIGALSLALILACFVGIIACRVKRTRQNGGRLRQRADSDKVDDNPVYGIYYNSAGDKVDYGTSEVQDENAYYAQ